MAHNPYLKYLILLILLAAAGSVLMIVMLLRREFLDSQIEFFGPDKNTFFFLQTKVLPQIQVCLSYSILLQI